LGGRFGVKPWRVLLATFLAWIAFASTASWAQLAEFKIENPNFGHLTTSMGASVAVDGDTLIAGAHHTRLGGMDSAGLARIYRADGLGGWALEAQLIASDAAGGDSFGWAVSISGDTAVVGANYDDNGEAIDTGSAYVFTRAGGVWTQQAKLTASDTPNGKRFGSSVSVSGDTVIVGADEDNGVNYWGVAYIFARSGEAWILQKKLNSSDVPGADGLGSAVSVWGDTAVVMAYGLGVESGGSACVFTRLGEQWTLNAKLSPTDTKEGDFYGSSVSVSGTTVVVGAKWTDEAGSNSGSAYVFARSGLTWVQQGKLTASDAAAEDSFGHTVSVWGDTAIVGTPQDDDRGSYSGSAYIFKRTGGAWVQQKKIIASDASESDYFGSAVSVSGSTAVIGAMGNAGPRSFSGSAYIFTPVAGVWSEQRNLSSSDSATNNGFGGTVSLSGDTAAVGGYGTNAVHIYTRLGGVWSPQQKITVPNADQYSGFGSSVSVSGDTVLSGAPGSSEGRGAVWVFTRSGGVWSRQQGLGAFNPAPSDRFGAALSVSGDTAVIGVPGDDDRGSSSGSAYIFVRSSGSWTRQQILTASDAAAGDTFGSSVSVSGDTAIVGAPLEDAGGSHSGSAYIFKRSNGVWSLQKKLTASDASEGDYFGSAVSVSGDIAVIGRPGGDDRGADSGSAYIFGRSGDMWQPQQKVTASDGIGDVFFGSHVSVSGDTVVVGSSYGPSAAYVFMRSDGVWTERHAILPSDHKLGDFAGGRVAADGGRLVIGLPERSDPEMLSGTAYIISLIPESEPMSPTANVGSSSRITWGWADESRNEARFDVYAAPGASAPETVVHTAAANTNSWEHGGLAANTQYAMQVAAINSYGAAKARSITAWTHAEVPVAPIVNSTTEDSIDVSMGESDANPEGTEYALRCTTTSQWVQADGSLGDAPEWQTSAAWGSTTVTGLIGATEYAFSARARNGAGVETADGPPVSAVTNVSPFGNALAVR